MLPFVKLDEEDFHILIMENTESPISINQSDFKNTFNILHKINFLKNINIDNNYLTDIDPDINFNTIETCDYIIDVKNLPKQSRKELSLMTFNIRSIRKNFENLNYLVSQINHKIHIITLTETWLGDSDDINDYKIDGYYPPLYQNRSKKHGGGVITYIHEDISTFKLNKKLTFMDEFNHCLATDITVNDKTTTVLNVYRSPSTNNTEFTSKLGDILQKLNNKKCYIMGDFNFNLININNHLQTEEYFNIMTSHSFKPLITKPTRITHSSKSLIDHIWTNDISEETMTSSYVIVTDITDHLPCLSIINTNHIISKGYRYIKTRLTNDERRNSIRTNIINISNY